MIQINITKNRFSIYHLDVIERIHVNRIMSTTIQSLNSYVEPAVTPSRSQPPTEDVINQIGSHGEMSRFVASSNVEMLWNIIIQNAVFHSAASVNDRRSKLRQHYIRHLKQYIENSIRSKTNIPLIDLNKSFIADFIRGFKETSPQPKRLDLSNPNPTENGVITIEEIKAERLSDFDNQYDKMKNDFEQYRVTEVVSDTKFTDNTVVEPLKNQDMDDILSRTIQYRTEQENASVPRNVNETDRARNWLNLGDSEKHITNVILPHPEREKKTVSFLTNTTEPLDDSQSSVSSIISTPPVTLQQSPIIVLQTRINAIEIKIDELYSMISGLVENTRCDTPNKENTIPSNTNDNSTSIETESEQQNDGNNITSVNV